jgi:hypothetical protein
VDFSTVAPEQDKNTKDFQSDMPQTEIFISTAVEKSQANDYGKVICSP